MEDGLSMDGASSEDKMRWSNFIKEISLRTGISDPEIFFQRFSNCGAMKDQMRSLKKASEIRLSELKIESQKVEGELEEMQYDTSVVGGTSSQHSHDKQRKVNEAMTMVKRVKEKSVGANQLVQQVLAGLHHIGELLGLPSPKEEPVSDLLHTIESVLETLVEEKDKSLQHATESPPSRMIMSREGLGVFIFLVFFLCSFILYHFSQIL